MAGTKKSKRKKNKQKASVEQNTSKAILVESAMPEASSDQVPLDLESFHAVERLSSETTLAVAGCSLWQSAQQAEYSQPNPGKFEQKKKSRDKMD